MSIDRTIVTFEASISKETYVQIQKAAELSGEATTYTPVLKVAAGQTESPLDSIASWQRVSAFR